MKKRRLSGLTLVEVMVSLVIIVILISISSVVMITGMNVFSENAVMCAAQDDGNNIYNFIADKLSYANEIIISSEESEMSGDYPYSETIIIDKNHMALKRKGEEINIYSHDTLHGNTCEIRIEDISENKKCMSLKVIMSRNGKTEYVKKGLIALLNYDYSNKNYKIGTSENEKIITYSYLE